MKYLFAFLVVMFCLLPHKASALACTGTSYNNFTCVKATAVSTGHSCGAAHTNVISVTNSGDMIIAYIDTTGTAITAVSGTGAGSGAWSVAGSLSSNNWEAGASTAIYTTIATTTGNLSMTVSCTGTFEDVLIEIHSSVGTVTVDCSSAWKPLVSQTCPGGGCPLASCTNTHANGLGMGFTDWNNGPTATNFAFITEAAENVAAVAALGAAGTVTCTFAQGPDTFIYGTLALSDGGSVASVPNAHGSIL